MEFDTGRIHKWEGLTNKDQVKEIDNMKLKKYKFVVSKIVQITQLWLPQEGCMRGGHPRGSATDSAPNCLKICLN